MQVAGRARLYAVSEVVNPARACPQPRCVQVQREEPPPFRSGRAARPKPVAGERE